MRKLGLVIVDGVGFRNFILSNFLSEVSKNFDEIIIYSGLKESVYNVSSYTNIKVTELDVYTENKKAWFYRKLNEISHLYKYKSSFGINDTLNLTKPKGYSRRAILNLIIRIIASVFHSEKQIKIYQKLVYKSFSKNQITLSFIKTLRNDRPNILFFTHQRPPYIAPLVYAANVNKIKTCSFIFSWDNLSSKGRIPAMFDSFFVWSELMQKELQFFYPSVKNKHIKIVGTPQFEPYVLERYYRNRDYFYNTFGLEKSKKTIYYSCGDVSTSKLDPLYIETIAKLIINNKIDEPVNFIVRTSPAEEGTRFLEIKEQYPFIKWNFPKWNLTRKNHTETWSQRVPEFNDICDLRALLSYADVNINMCSTMSLDFMIFNKPVINTVFGNKENGLYNDQRFLNYNHYKKVIESGAVRIAKTELELIGAINKSLLNPLELEKQREKILNLEISKPLKGTSQRIVDALIQLC